MPKSRRDLPVTPRITELGPGRRTALELTRPVGVDPVRGGKFDRIAIRTSGLGKERRVRGSVVDRTGGDLREQARADFITTLMELYPTLVTEAHAELRRGPRRGQIGGEVDVTVMPSADAVAFDLASRWHLENEQWFTRWLSRAAASGKTLPYAWFVHIPPVQPKELLVSAWDHTLPEMLKRATALYRASEAELKHAGWPARPHRQPGRDAFAALILRLAGESLGVIAKKQSAADEQEAAVHKRVKRAAEAIGIAVPPSQNKGGRPRKR
jgi:hypothetical protein